MEATLFAPAEQEVVKPSLMKMAPRDYQVIDHDESFRLWDSGTVGTLTRIATGLGKTFCACLKADTWLQRGDDYRIIVVSFEQQLVWQFAEEIEDFLGLTAGIEMNSSAVDPENLPKIVVASRQTIVVHDGPSQEQLDELLSLGIKEVGACHQRKCETYLKHLRKGGDVDVIHEDIERFNRMPEVKDGMYSRLFKFDNRLNWLVCFDEAHRFAYHLKSVNPIVDWFEQNPNSRRFGMTATPKRSDKISVGDKMFPGVAIDYPLFHVSKPNAVSNGYAVPYLQKYIEVEGVDFKNIKKIAGDFDDADLERVLGEESVLARLIEPLLDLVGDRQTLIFSPGVEMANNVARYINARCEAKCPDCGKKKWFPNKLVGDGAQCSCGHLIGTMDLVKFGEQAKAIWGEVKTLDRKEIYKGHQEGSFQFLSVCGLCIAKGSRILTDAGEIPIEDVTSDMKLWDGVEFVSHGGVISKGIKPVIQYAGLTATEDHNVWTKYGWKTMAYCKKGGIAIAVSGIGGIPVWESDGYYRHDDSSGISTTATSGSDMRQVSSRNDANVLPSNQGAIKLSCVPCQRKQSKSNQSPRSNAFHDRTCILSKAESCRWYNSSSWRKSTLCITSAVHRLRQRICATIKRIKSRPFWLQKLLEVNWHSYLALVSLPSCQTTMHQHTQSRLSRLRREGNTLHLRINASDGEMDHSKFGCEATFDDRSNRQQRSLLPRKSSICDSHTASQQPQEAEVYDILNAGPRHRFTANGLIVSNCREGYNDPNIACVAVFRPVSREASSLAEQMKGRACRPLRGLLNGLNTKEERLEAIAKSSKPNALIVDLVGISSLTDCASTIQIYADGLPDEIVERAEKILADKAVDEETDVASAIEKAKEEIEEERERIKKEREEAERRRQEAFALRAKAQAEARYTAHDVGHGSNFDPNLATPAQINFIGMLGMELINPAISKKQAGRIINMLKSKVPVEQVAAENRIKSEQWRKRGPSIKQLNLMKIKDIPVDGVKTMFDASERLSARLNPHEFVTKKIEAIDKCKNGDELTSVGKDLAFVKGILPESYYSQLVEKGKHKRELFVGDSWEK